MMLILLLLSPAHAACSISRLSPPEGSTLTARRNFTFLVTADCVTTSFAANGSARRTPVYVGMVGADRKMQIVPSVADWSRWTTAARSTVRWSVTATDAAGVTANRGATAQLDLDADGYTRSGGDAGDCDSVAAVHPGAVEVCDGVDNDCSGVIDDAAVDVTAWYADTDGDGFGDSSVGVSACVAPFGYVAAAGDCDDGDAAVSPEAEEVCNDGVDQDCGGVDDLCRIGGAWSLGDADARILGEGAYAFAGQSVATAGDVNLDGYADVIVGAPGAGSAYRGAAAVVFGPLAGDIPLSAAGAVLLGSDDDRAGWSVAGGGDVDQDGYPDIVVASYNTDEGGVHDSGAAWVAYGPFSGETALNSAGPALSGVATSDEAGLSVAVVGDVNGDTYDDVLIGAPGVDSGGPSAGAAYLVLGPVASSDTLSGADQRFLGEGYADQAGYAVASVGDFDGDGLADILIGSEAAGGGAGANPSGAAWLVSYPTMFASGGSMSLADADAKFVGEALGDNAGHAVAGVGDANGDGFTDLLIGAPGVDGHILSGAAYVVHGPVAGAFALSDATARFLGEPYGVAGLGVSGAGDVNGDGEVDFLIGGYGVGGGASLAGGAYLALGPASGNVELSVAEARFMGEDTIDYAGMAIAGVGDTDQDGFDDLLIGASGANALAPDGGAAYLWRGAAR